MKLPEYNPEGKKLTFAQHLKKMRDLEAKNEEKGKESGGLKPGTCPECGRGRFILRCEKGGMIVRTCRHCSAKKVF